MAEFPDDGKKEAARRVDAIYRAESRRVLATLIRLLGDFDLAGNSAAVVGTAGWMSQSIRIGRDWTVEGRGARLQAASGVDPPQKRPRARGA